MISVIWKSDGKYLTWIINHTMLKNYLKIALRSINRNKGYSLINIGGLAVGMSVAMLIALWIVDELSFNKYNSNYDRIAQVYQKVTFNKKIETSLAAPIPLGVELAKSYESDFKYVVLSSWTNNHILSFNETNLPRSGNYMQPDAPRLLDLKIVKGTIDGLKDPGSILLSESLSKALFGDRDPINELMKIDNKLDVKVTGVYKDIPFNSDFNEVQFIAPWDLYMTSEAWLQYAKDQWGNNSFQLFVQIADNADMKQVSDKIRNVKFDHDELEREFNPIVFLHPMKDWHLRSSWHEGVQTGGPIQYVWLFGFVAVFVLLLACINFMNLSTARSEKRAKEVGIRKSIGSMRQQLINQFLSESLLVVVIAFCVSVILISLALPFFNQIAEKQITPPFSSPWFWISSMTFIITTGILSGSYPALYLSSFQPVKVLKGTFRVGRFAAAPRRVLVVLQFTISITLIICTLVVYQQIQFAKNRPLGFDRKGVIMIEMKSPDFYGKYDVFRSQLKEAGAIEEMAESSSPLTGVWSNNGGYEWEGKDPNLHGEFATIWVSHDFGRTAGWKIKEGRDFSRDFASDSSAVVINESAVRFMGIEDPVGKIIRDNGNGEHKIIGVVGDLLMDSPFRAVKQTLYFNDYNMVNWMVLKLNPAVSLNESVARTEKVFRKILPNVPFDYKFVDEEHARKFASEERVGTLSGIFSALAIFISCLGLFALASFVAEQRTKEIGIRKVLGASVAGLWQMLSKDFLILVIISCAISVPLADRFSNHWLASYDYRTEISLWIFVGAGLGALVITLFTVSFQAIRAAVANPVKSLRSE
ncbi:MAG TPA: ABC transporter permease [Cyclobacteriaceae bacterium]|nr:ABC transporter permease [Cyclobacteriaceae bacterium]